MKHYLEFPTWIRPQIVSGLPFQWYGLFYVVVIVVIYFLFMYQLKRRTKENFTLMKDTSEEMFVWLILAGLIGSRVFYALFDATTGEFFTRPWRILWPFEGKRFIGFQGMNFFGGAFGVMLAFAIFSKIKKMNLLFMMDMILAVFPLGFAIERLGAFINGELYGRVCSLPWGVVFPDAQKFPASEKWVKEIVQKIGMSSADSLINLPRHPTQFYELLFGGLLLWVLFWFVVRKMKRFDGFLSASYLIAFGVVRFFVDYFRLPGNSTFAIRLSNVYNPPYLFKTPLNLTLSQIFSIVMVTGGVIMLICLSKKSADNETLHR